MFAIPVLRFQLCKDLGPQSGEVYHVVNASIFLTSNVKVL